MASNDQLNEHLVTLLDRLKMLSERQEQDREELRLLQTEIRKLLADHQLSKSTSSSVLAPQSPALDTRMPERPNPASESEPMVAAPASSTFDAIVSATVEHASVSQPKPQSGSTSSSSTAKTVPGFASTAPRFAAAANLEKFIGENLLNKVGIVITVLGIGIGAKYAIDHDMISALTRIVLGYVLSAALFAVGTRLKQRYPDYSAVLVSGAMAGMYFISYAAYSFYSLIPQAAAFALMALFTLYTVVASMQYNRQIIALIGLVGAYAVPFLLSDGSGRVEILFSYIALINVGILFLGWKRAWVLLVGMALGLSWLSFFSWHTLSDNTDQHIVSSYLFILATWISFYAAAFGISRHNKTKSESTSFYMITANALAGFLAGYSVVQESNVRELSGLYTACNALLHFGVLMLQYRRGKLSATGIQVLGALVIFFITITIPIQLHGSTIAVCWAMEALVLLYIGSRQGTNWTRPASGVIAFLALINFFDELGHHSRHFFDYFDYAPYRYQVLTPFANGEFFSLLLVGITTGLWAYLFIKSNENKENVDPTLKKQRKPSLRGLTVVGVTLMASSELFATMSTEISQYFNVWQYQMSAQLNEYDTVVGIFAALQQSNLFFLFVLVGGLIALRNTASPTGRSWMLSIHIISLLYFILGVLNLLMRLSYEQAFQPDANVIGIDFARLHPTMGLWRYLSFAFAFALTRSSIRFLKESQRSSHALIASFLAHIVVVCIISNELLHWMQILHVQEAERTSLSILWGLYSLCLISYGIVKKRKASRIVAISLFGFTLLKLFVFDLSTLGAGAKTIAFVGLGLLLLLISFLYNKYKSLIFGDDAGLEEHNQIQNLP